MASRRRQQRVIGTGARLAFTVTFRVLAEYSQWEYTDLQVEATGTVDKADSGYSFSQIILRPHLKITGERARELHLL
jgi:hypothetical protein